MSENDGEGYSIITGEIPKPKESHYKHKTGTNYSKRVQKNEIIQN